VSLLPLLASANINVETARKVDIGGLTFNVNIIYGTVIAGLIVLGVGFWVRNRITSEVPNKAQLVWETVVGAVERQVETNIGPAGKRVVPLAITLFFFILICNWLELLPTGSAHNNLPAPTGDVNLTFAMAIYVIVMVHAAGFRENGFRGYMRHFFHKPWLMVPINLIEEVAKPITLALRLFGNIFSGGLMLILIAGLFTYWIVPIPDVIWKLFEFLLIGPIQAFIFALLTILYFEAAVKPAEEGAH
jgi:F-type H+-transporting ATPase subunit a